jgi:ligand-binding SRPBCC domain-containing protein
MADILQIDDGGTLVSDFVRYAAPGGRLVEWFFVRRDVERIFQLRREQLLALFDKRLQPEAERPHSDERGRAL